MQTTLDRVRAGEADPPCQLCGSILKSATIFFGEALVAADLNRAFAAAAQADLLLSVGTTLQVYPVADMVPIAASNGASIVIVNGEPTPMDDLAAVVVLGREAGSKGPLQATPSHSQTSLAKPALVAPPNSTTRPR